MKKKFPSKRKIPLKYFFSVETLKNNNFLKKYIIQFHELFYTFYILKKNVFVFFKKSWLIHSIKYLDIFFTKGLGWRVWLWCWSRHRQWMNGWYDGTSCYLICMYTLMCYAFTFPMKTLLVYLPSFSRGLTMFYVNYDM